MKTLKLKTLSQQDYINNMDGIQAPNEVLEFIKIMATKMTTDQWTIFTHHLELHNELEIPSLKLTTAEQEVVKAGSYKIKNQFL